MQDPPPIPFAIVFRKYLCTEQQQTTGYLSIYLIEEISTPCNGLGPANRPQYVAEKINVVKSVAAATITCQFQMYVHTIVHVRVRLRRTNG